jgi:hypothetical protein
MPPADLRTPDQSEPQPDHSQCKESRLRKYSQNDRVHVDTSNQKVLPSDASSATVRRRWRARES